MSQTDPWELTDEEIWGEVDHAALMEAFRRSEISERREGRYAGFGLRTDFIVRAVQAFSHAAEAFWQAGQTLRAVFVSLQPKVQRRYKTFRPKGPRTAPHLKTALHDRFSAPAPVIPVQRQHRRQHR